MKEKILIATPISKRHNYCVDAWYKSIQQYKNVEFDVLIIDTTADNGEYFKILKSKFPDAIIQRHEWDTNTIHFLQMLAHVREKIRNYFIDHNYSHLLFIDADIVIYPEYLKRLIKFNKDRCGPLVHVYSKPKDLPCVFHDGYVNMQSGLSYCTWTELFNCDRKLIRCYANALGCSLIKRSVMEKCHFNTHNNLIYGEDLWFNNEMADRKFEMYVDTAYKVYHNNVDWSIPIKQDNSKKQMNLSIAIGTPDATEIMVR